MKTPNLFLHFWTEDKNTLTFEDVLNLEINPSVLSVIQTEIMNQLNSKKIIDLLPNFDWDSKRFHEKWTSITESMLLQVKLPEAVWMDWIESILLNTSQNMDPNILEPLEEKYPSFEELLTADVYYSRPSDSLEDLPEDSVHLNQSSIDSEESDKANIRIEQQTVTNTESNENQSSIDSEESNQANIRIDQLTVTNTESNENQSSNDTEESDKANIRIDQLTVINTESNETIGAKTVKIKKNSEEEKFTKIKDPTETEIVFPIANPFIDELKMNSDHFATVQENSISESTKTEKKVIDMLAKTPEERVFETLSVSGNVLKDQIQTTMTESLAENIPLFLKLNLIQNLFDGRVEILDQLIQYVDHEAAPNADWKAEINLKFGSFQTQENKELWSELLHLIERKFN